MRPTSPRALAACVLAMALAIAIASCGGAAFEAGSPSDGGAPVVGDGGPPGDTALPIGDAHPAADADAAEPPSDAAADALDADDGGASPFACSAQDASTTFFCADFDHVATVGTGWSVALAVAGGTNAFDTVNYRSPPNGYAATTPAITDKASFAALEETLTTSSPLDLAFSLHMDDIDSTAGASAILVSLEVGAELTLDLVLTGTGLTLQQSTPAEEGGMTTQSDSVGAIGTTAWTRVQIELDRSVTPWTIVVRRDTAVKLSTNAIAMPSDTGVQLTVGITFVGPPSAGYQATYDDVILQAL